MAQADFPVSALAYANLPSTHHGGCKIFPANTWRVKKSRPMQAGE